MKNLNSENSRIKFIKQEITREILEQEDEVLSFDRFMEIALYLPEYGYYEKKGDIFGKNGDFVTASEIGNLFGATLANELVNVLNQIGGGFYDFGAGTGRLSKTILERLNKCKLDFEPKFYLIERSENLVKVQKNQLRSFSNITWHNCIETVELNGFLIANELFDAMPAKCFVKNDEQVSEYGVGIKGNEFSWMLKKSPVPVYLEERLEQKNDGFRTEYISAAYSWLDTIYKQSNQIVLLILDYGSLQDEFYHDNKSDGTIKCHYKHHLTYDPLIDPGLKDITVSVDFSLLADQATDIGFDVLGFSSLEKLLTNLGIMAVFEQEIKELSQANFKISHEAKQLLMPNEMGYSIKAMALAKDFDGILLGFKER